MRKIRKCRTCGRHTLLERCCGEETVSAHPPKYSPQDKYAKYRRIERYGRGFE
ncbi:ribosome biogenesis protein [Candidatus Micrarchaeota archaeon]|nr:MAG: ribosome biogenesis protein [Candidatus Micrarchaeota archaeon]